MPTLTVPRGNRAVPAMRQRWSGLLAVLAAGGLAALARAAGTADVAVAAAPDSWCGREETAARLALASLAAVTNTPDSALMAAHTRLGNVLAAQDRLRDAEPYYRQAVIIALSGLKHLTNNLPEVMRQCVDARYTFGTFLRAAGVFNGAESELRWARDQGTRFLGPQTPSTLRASAALASVASVVGDAGQVTQAVARAYASVKAACGDRDMELAGLDEMAGLALMRAKRFADAIPVYEDMLRICQTHLPPDNPRLAEVLNNLASAQFEAGQHQAAQRSLEKALAIRERGLGTQHPLTLRSRENLAKAAREAAAKPATR